ncbi:MAG: 3-deoxy-manno-octulosonate cytidylyltransferase [Elusimicrobiota bacterium]|jgi:3-deoxy-manno-octulosonate cytidylyltransferase (CMP-KDO synthetase)
MTSTKIAAVIPARMGSSRFPGKPLLEIAGLPMVEHVRRRALMSGTFSDVVVATCDAEIQQAIEGFGGRVIMTKASHPGATDRVAEAVSHLSCTHVVNVQGDEVLVLPEDLRTITQTIAAAPDAPAWNAIAPIASAKELADRSIVKCIASCGNRILYCSRDFSRLPFKNQGFDPVHIILGLVAFRRDFLTTFCQLPRTAAETLESIDQNRIIEHDHDLRGILLSRGYPGINEPREAEQVNRLLKEDELQQAVLQQLLAIKAA